MQSIPPRGVSEDGVSDDGITTSADSLKASDAQSDASTLGKSGIQPVWDDDLQAVVDAWPGLSSEARVEVMAIIEADVLDDRPE